MSTGTIRLMSWNIHRGIGPDRRFNLDRIAAVIRRHSPDILALQEIDTRGRDPTCLVPLRELVTPEGHFAEARTKIAHDGHYGHALFSRWPLSDIVVHDLTMWRREPRSAIEATVETEQGALMQGLSVRLFLERPSAQAELDLGEDARFYPSDAALARWRESVHAGAATVVYD